MISGSLVVLLVLSAISVSESQLPKRHGDNRLFNANDRVHVVPPGTLLLAQKNDLRLTISTGDLDTVFSFQRQETNPGSGITDAVPDGDQMLPVIHRDGGTYFQLTPLRLGKVMFELHATFKDGGKWDQTLELEVEPPLEAPLSLWVNRSEIYQILDEANGFEIVPYATYPGIKRGVRLDDHFVSFSVRTVGDRKVVNLNPATGQVKPVAIGEALIQTSYAGMSTLTCVVVSVRNSPLGVRKPHCLNLLLGGERLP